MKDSYIDTLIDGSFESSLMDYVEKEIPIKIMDAILDYNNISEDIICIVNVEIEEILEWIERYKSKTYINYKGKEYAGKDKYPDVFIFDQRDVLDKFIRSLRLSESSLEGFIVHDIKYELSSSIDRIRIIKNYNFEDKPEKIKGMCEFIDIQSYESGKTEDILEDRLLIKIEDIDHTYREIFYSIED